MQPSFAAWADPRFVFRMPDETPFGLDQSLYGKPIIDYQVNSLMSVATALAQERCNIAQESSL